MEEPENKPLEHAQKKKSKGRRALLNLCYIAIFAAVITVCSYISVPVGDIPVTLQTLAICLTAGLLGWKRGTLCVLVYIFMGICGIPVFANFKNFYALLASPSAGYVVGFIFTALLVGFASDNLKRLGSKAKRKGFVWAIQFTVLLLSMAAGILVCYLFGTLWYMFIFKGSATTENLQFALTWCVYPYILPDLVKILLAAVLVDRLKRFVKH
ncbi:MAG: biotin transporter BioY [Clostridia bacterium]|nr:biotin transporter BioY [Clostridia bacterium]